MSEDFIRIDLIVKLLIVAATYRLWGPVLKAILRELRAAADTPRGSLLERTPPPSPPRPPGEDPWVSVPLAAHRNRSRSRPRPNRAGRVSGRVGKTQRGAFRPVRRSGSSRAF